VRPLDANGAGGACGAFLAALARGESPERAARVANVTGAPSRLREGPATAPALDAARAAMGEAGEAAQGPPREDEA
jgi:sugar/nucleoside kinase (ribokinase family)